jgi:hypothetical protein
MQCSSAVARLRRSCACLSDGCHWQLAELPRHEARAFRGAPAAGPYRAECSKAHSRPSGNRVSHGSQSNIGLPQPSLREQRPQRTRGNSSERNRSKPELRDLHRVNCTECDTYTARCNRSPPSASCAFLRDQPLDVTAPASASAPPLGVRWQQGWLAAQRHPLAHRLSRAALATRRHSRARTGVAGAGVTVMRFPDASHRSRVNCGGIVRPGSVRHSRGSTT